MRSPAIPNEMTRAKTQFWLDPKLWAISVAETLAWAGMFYMFPALLLRWQRYFEWNISQLSLGLMFALVISAITGLLSGKLIDKGLGRPLVSLSVVFGGLSILCLLFVQSLWQFYFVWGVVGIFMGGCFYDPCFALLIRKYGKCKGTVSDGHFLCRTFGDLKLSFIVNTGNSIWLEGQCVGV